MRKMGREREIMVLVLDQRKFDFRVRHFVPPRLEMSVAFLFLHSLNGDTKLRICGFVRARYPFD